MTSETKKCWGKPTLQAIDIRETAQKNGSNEANACGVAVVGTKNCPIS